MIRYSTFLEFSNLKNSLKSFGNSITAVHHPPHEFHGVQAFLRGAVQPIVRVVGFPQGDNIKRGPVNPVPGHIRPFSILVLIINKLRLRRNQGPAGCPPHPGRTRRLFSSTLHVNIDMDRVDKEGSR